MANLGVEVLAVISFMLVLDRFTTNIYILLAATVGPFVGQNASAGRYSRVRLGMTAVYLFAAVVSIVLWTIALVGGQSISRFFAAGALDEHIAGAALTTYPLFIVASALTLICNSALNACKKGMTACPCR